MYISWSENFCNGKVNSHMFPKFLLHDSLEEYEELIEKYHKFQLPEEIGIPLSGIKIIKPVKDILRDRLWHCLSTLKDCIVCPRFFRLTKGMKLIIIIPHSNAEKERVFWLVRKNKTCFRLRS